MIFFGEGWQDILRYNRLDDFDALWDMDVEWFEQPNERRGGWSGVGRIRLRTPNGGDVGVFIKRQQNHTCRSLRHPLRGTLTFAREFENIRHFQRAGIPTLEPIYFGQRQVNGDRQGILLTLELAGFSPMDATGFLPGKDGLLASIKARRALFTTLADALRRLHAHRRQHSCLYFKHIFIRPVREAEFEIRLIDLEKSRWHPLVRRSAIRDLYTLSRHAEGWPLTDHMRFFLLYRQETRLSPASKRLWRDIAARHRTRGNKLKGLD